ncbi:hypothetical protein [Halomontanus rarus]|uniref:hypothetical protein n=1 Tax=Halomontanus rarus TaxID=3034020 RepID=UPI00307BF3B8
MHATQTRTTTGARQSEFTLELEDCGVPISNSEIPITVSVDRHQTSRVIHIERKHTWIVEANPLGTAELTGVYNNDEEVSLPSTVPNWISAAVGVLGIDEVSL